MKGLMAIVIFLLLVMQAATLGAVLNLAPPAGDAAAPFAVEDVNRDGVVNVLDVQLVVKAYLEGE